MINVKAVELNIKYKEYALCLTEYGEFKHNTRLNIQYLHIKQRFFDSIVLNYLALIMLDLSNCPNLESLEVIGNKNLKYLDLSKCPKLFLLYCDNILDIEEIKHIEDVRIYI